MAASHQFISNLLERMRTRDNDIRFMAINDFEAELQSESFCMDQEAEKKISNQIVLLLDDKCADVQGRAVNCLRPLVCKVHDTALQQILQKLASSVVTKTDEDKRDIAVVGLNGIIAAARDQDGSMLVNTLVPPLAACLSETHRSAAVHIDCIGLLTNLFKRFGSLMGPQELSEVQKSVFPHLSASSNKQVRKVAAKCLAHMCVHIHDENFNDIICFCAEQAHNAQDPEEVKTHIQLIGSIARFSGHRLGRYMDRVIPLIATAIRSKDFEDDIELKENCFQTFDALVLRCPGEVTEQLPEIIALGMEYLHYDPNYAGDDDDMGESGDDGDWGYDSEEGGDGEDADYEVDDDDISGKVRKSCARLVASIAQIRPDCQEYLFATVLPGLVDRLSEREDYVKLDIYQAFSHMLKMNSKRPPGLQVRVGGGERSGEESPVQLLRQHVSSIIRVLSSQLSSKATKLNVKEGIFVLLKDLVGVADSMLLAEHINKLMPGLLSSLSDRNVALKVIAMQFLRALLISHPRSLIKPHFDALCEPVCSMLHDNQSKQVSSDGLRVVEQLVCVLREELSVHILRTVASPLPSLHPAESSQADDMNIQSYAPLLYAACMGKLLESEVDSEVKDCAIDSTAMVLAVLGDHLQGELNSCLSVLLDRLGNEITRLASARAFTTLAISPLQLNLSSVLQDVLPILTSFLRKSNRNLRLNALLALHAIVQGGRLRDHGELVEKVLTELACLVTDADLHLCHYAFVLTTACLRSHPSSVRYVSEALYPRALALLQSPLLQGHALESLMEMMPVYVAMCERNTPSQTQVGAADVVADMLQLTHSPNVGGGGRQAAVSISKCVAVVLQQADEDVRCGVVERFVEEIRQNAQGWPLVVALLSVGEIGQRADLTRINQHLYTVVCRAFEAEGSTEEIKSSASFALGGVAAGNLGVYLNAMLEDIRGKPSMRYNLLHALKDTICILSVDDVHMGKLQEHLSSIVPILLENSASEKEGTRTVVAECLGRLALTCLDLVEKMHERLMEPSPLVRCTMVNALRYMIPERPHPIDLRLYPAQGGLMKGFMSCLLDEDLAVRKAALMALTHVAHNKPALIVDLLPEIMPALYGETKVKTALQRKVEFGPFRHSVDDGLPTRKASFECMYTLLDHCGQLIDLREFVAHVVGGLTDVYDIKMLCHLMLIKLSESTAGSSALLALLDSVVEPLRSTVRRTMKETAVKQDVDRNEEQIRSAVRAVQAIAKIPYVEKHPRFRDFLMQIRSSHLEEKYGE